MTTLSEDYSLLFKNIIANPRLYKLVRQEHPKMIEKLREYMLNSSDEDPYPTCINFVEEHPDPSNSPIVLSIFAIIYVHIFVLGLVGNISIMFLTLRHRHLQTVQNIFILNLAISDVIVCLLSLPFTPVTNIYKTWYFGQPICHLLPFVQAVSVFVSTFSLSAIAIDRYNLVVRPHARPLSLKSAILVASVLWVLSVIVSLPYGYYMKLESYPGYCGQFCSEQWPNQHIRRSYSLIVLIAQFLVPFATMSICYSFIFMKLNERNKTKLKRLNERAHLLESSRMIPTPIPPDSDSLPGTPPKFASFEEKQRTILTAQQRRTTTILASMVLIFGLTWLPQNIVTLIIEYDESILQRGTVNFTYIISMITHGIAMTTNIANPILYAWLNATFKELFVRTFTQRKTKKPTIALERPSRTSGLANGNGYTTKKTSILNGTKEKTSDSL